MKINITTLILIALLIGSVIWAFSERSARTTIASSTKQDSVLNNPTAQKTGEHVDEKGSKHSTFDVTANKIDDKLVAVSKSVVDTIAKLSNVKPSQVTDWQEVAITSEAKYLKAQKTVDSLKQVVYTYKGQYISLLYRPNTGDTTVNIDGTFDYKYNAKVTTVKGATGLRLLGIPVGTQRQFADVSGDDTNMTINGLRTLQIVPNEQPIKLNAYAFANYLFTDKDIQIGAGAQIDVGRLNLNGGYYYNTADFSSVKRPKPFAGAKYSFFK